GDALRWSGVRSRGRSQCRGRRGDRPADAGPRIRLQPNPQGRCARAVDCGGATPGADRRPRVSRRALRTPHGPPALAAPSRRALAAASPPLPAAPSSTASSSAPPPASSPTNPSSVAPAPITASSAKKTVVAPQATAPCSAPSPIRRNPVDRAAIYPPAIAATTRLAALQTPATIGTTAG